MFSKLPREKKERMMESVQQYFIQERSEEIGSIAAEALLDHMIKVIGPYIYNQAVQDARKLLHERMLSIEDELYSLERPETEVRR